jgi:hypothetical protein
MSSRCGAYLGAGTGKFIFRLFLILSGVCKDTFNLVMKLSDGPLNLYNIFASTCIG